MSKNLLFIISVLVITAVASTGIVMAKQLQANANPVPETTISIQAASCPCQQAGLDCNCTDNGQPCNCANQCSCQNGCHNPNKTTIN